jgi:hypothetical protein
MENSRKIVCEVKAYGGPSGRHILLSGDILGDEVEIRVLNENGDIESAEPIIKSVKPWSNQQGHVTLPKELLGKKVEVSIPLTKYRFSNQESGKHFIILAEDEDSANAQAIDYLGFDLTEE